MVFLSWKLIFYEFRLSAAADPKQTFAAGTKDSCCMDSSLQSISNQT